MLHLLSAFCFRFPFPFSVSSVYSCAALTVAQGPETADKNLKEMKAHPQELDSTSSSPAGVKVKSESIQKSNAKKKFSTREGAQSGVTCHCYGHPGHLATTCRFKDQGCHRCKKRGVT